SRSRADCGRPGLLQDRGHRGLRVNRDRPRPAAPTTWPVGQSGPVPAAPGRADDAAIRARVAGRDPGTNVVALQLESPIEFDRPEPADPALGALVLALAADAGGAPMVRLGIVRSLGPAWHSRSSARRSTRSR